MHRLKKTMKYKFEDEDPLIYSDDEDYGEVIKLQCEWLKRSPSMLESDKVDYPSGAVQVDLAGIRWT